MYIKIAFEFCRSPSKKKAIVEDSDDSENEPTKPTSPIRRQVISKPRKQRDKVISENQPEVLFADGTVRNDSF